MTEFTLDTSGVVMVPVAIEDGTLKPTTRGRGFVRPTKWPDLSPFAQGYVEAAFASSYADWERQAQDVFVDGLSPGNPLGFSDLAPATLAAMLKDCERWLDHFPALNMNNKKSGAHFWELRQAQHVPRPGYPPLTLYLADDGLIYSRETS